MLPVIAPQTNPESSRATATTDGVVPGCLRLQHAIRGVRPGGRSSVVPDSLETERHPVSSNEPAQPDSRGRRRMTRLAEGGTTMKRVGMLAAIMAFLILAAGGCARIPSQQPISIAIQGDPVVVAQVAQILEENPNIVAPDTQIEYSIAVVKPDPSVDYKIMKVAPDPNVEYKISVWRRCWG